MTRRIAARAIIYQDGLLFCVRQKKLGKVNAYWSVPGGGLNSTESLTECLTREMIEETGITPAIGKLLFVQQFKNNNSEEHLEFFFHVTNAEEYEIIDTSLTTHGQLELEEYGFIPASDPTLLPEFLQVVNIPTCIEADETKLYSYL